MSICFRVSTEQTDNSNLASKFRRPGFFVGLRDTIGYAMSTSSVLEAGIGPIWPIMCQRSSILRYFISPKANANDIT